MRIIFVGQARVQGAFEHDRTLLTLYPQRRHQAVVVRRKVPAVAPKVVVVGVQKCGLRDGRVGTGTFRVDLPNAVGDGAERPLRDVEAAQVVAVCADRVRQQQRHQHRHQQS